MLLLKDIARRYTVFKGDSTTPHYFDVYERVLSGWCGKSPTVLEIGVEVGGSLSMWRDWFGSGAKVYGIDNREVVCGVNLRELGVFIGDQADEDFLKRTVESIGPPDIIIDDGSHVMEDQIGSFNFLWRKVSGGGTYVIEDLHTSYWSGYGGPPMTTDFLKELVDVVNTREASVESILFETSMAFIKKRP
jgi:cephalosporin hydroxylase